MHVCKLQKHSGYTTLHLLANLYRRKHRTYEKCRYFKFKCLCNAIERPDIIFSAVTSTGAGIARNNGSIPSRGKRLISCLKFSERFWIPYSLLVNGYGCSFPGIRRPKHEADHLPPSYVEVRNDCRHDSTPPIAFVC